MLRIRRLFRLTILCAALTLMAASVPSTAVAGGDWWCLWLCGGGHDDSDSVGRIVDPDRNVPEVDPTAAALAITLVGGGLAILYDRRRRG